jgi:methylmalonyl-CoA mutase N-terminal domain/subunit
VTDTPDPLAGSYFVEALTDRLEAAAQGYLAEIDGMGGAIAAIEGGYQQRQIQDAAYRVQREIERHERIIVGVNRYTDDEVVSPPLQRIDPGLETEQTARIAHLRATRDEAAWRTAMERLADAADSSENLVPVIIDAVKARATLGEISDRLRAAWGEHREVVPV